MLPTFGDGWRIAIPFFPPWNRSYKRATHIFLGVLHRWKGWLVYLLDTNVLSLLIRARPHPQLTSKLREQPAECMFTSCICVMELRHGAARRRDEGALWRRIEREILPRVQVLSAGIKEALVAGDILAHLWAAGTPIDVEDVLIGATAVVHGFVVVTNNLAHFRRIPNLQVEDWTT